MTKNGDILLSFRSDGGITRCFDLGRTRWLNLAGRRCVRSAQRRRADLQVTELLRPAVSALACENTTSEQSLDRLSSCHWLPVPAACSGCRGAASLMKGQEVNSAQLEKKVAVLKGNSRTSRFCDGLYFLRILHKHRKLARGDFSQSQMGRVWFRRFILN